jgi:asparagine synthase (glutamine-hydrolysing)
MCGIAGFRGYPNGVDLAHNANRLLAARGPDARGVWNGDGLALAHRRLAIIDLDSRADQPFEKDGLVIVFNGEIYNHTALRDDLRAQHGARFTTCSDTEVVLEAYRHLGVGCLERLVGMFAFAIYCTRTRTLFLARDHFGIKPLCYVHERGRFAFASEIKALLPALEESPRVAPAPFVAALAYLWVPGNTTCFQGVKRLPPAHYAQVDTNGRLTVRRYWTPPSTSDASRSPAQWVEALDAAVADSVRRHLVADVEVGAFLSGGLDSSLLCALARPHVDRLRTFTIGVAPADERIERMPPDHLYARRVAAALGFDHHEIVVDPDIVRDLPRAVGWLDEPIGDPAAISTHLICRAAAERGIRVLLSGMGADEFLCGYRRQHATLLAQRWQRLPPSVRRATAAAVARAPVRVLGHGLRTVRWAKRFLEFAELPLADGYRMSYSYYGDAELEALLGGAWTEEVAALGREHRLLFDSAFPDDPVNRMCFTDLHMFLPGLNLAYTDRASMAASTEIRVPFVDKHVAELAMSIPGGLKLSRGRSKYVLKQAALRHLPRDIVHRRKASFGAPIRAWISGPLSDMVADLLCRERTVRRGWFDPAFVQRLLDDDRSGRADNAYRIYQLLTIEIWFERYFDDRTASRIAA